MGQLDLLKTWILLGRFGYWSHHVCSNQSPLASQSETSHGTPQNDHFQYETHETQTHFRRNSSQNDSFAPTTASLVFAGNGSQVQLGGRIYFPQSEAQSLGSWRGDRIQMVKMIIVDYRSDIGNRKWYAHTHRCKYILYIQLTIPVTSWLYTPSYTQ